MRLSPSKISKFLFCGHSYMLGEMEKLRGLSSGPQLRGLGVHKGAQVNYEFKKNSHEDLPIDMVVDAATDHVKKLAADGVSKDEDDFRPPSMIVADIVDHTAALSKLYHREIARSTQPALVEEKIELIVSPDVTLVSVLDIMSDRGMVTDIKTSGSSKSQAEADRSLQLTMQHVAANALHEQKGTPAPRGVRLDILVDTKVPKVQQFTSTREEKHTVALVNITNAVRSAIGAGVFLPAAPTTTWKCSPKYCQHFHQCKYVGNV